jgi:hypothetical protein
MDNKKPGYTNYVIGGIAGALIGVVAAVLIDRAAELNEEDWESTKKRLSGIGFRTISLLWSLTERGKDSRH